MTIEPLYSRSSEAVWWLCLVFCCLVLVPCAESAPLHRSNLPDIETPPGATWHYVAQEMTYNSLPMSIKMFEVAGTEADVEKFYSSLWYSMGFAKRGARDLGLQRILSLDWRGYYITVQFNEEDGTVRGKIVVTETPGKKRASFKTQVPVPPASVVASVVKTRDYNKVNESITIESRKSVKFVRRFYENEMESRGYQRVGGYEQGSGDVVMFYQDSEEQLQIIIKSLTGGDTSDCHVLIHLTR